MRIYLGKFSSKYPEQIEKKYYAAGEEGNSWYGNVRPGEYVFVAYQGKIIALWKAREYSEIYNQVANAVDGVLLFDEIKNYDDISLVNDFTRYKHFLHDLNLVNKAIKSVKGLGFIPIKTTKQCPHPEDIEFKNNKINMYVALDQTSVDYRQGDILVRINNKEEMRILGIERYVNNKFEIYQELNSLYEVRNKENERYTIRELNDYALKDNAPKKRKFLVTLIEELEENGYMKVPNPIKLYDNLLVGRKKYGKVSNSDDNRTNDEEEALEDEEFADNISYENISSLLNFNPNLILYGPPGTGKTYATKRIIDAFEKKHFDNSSSYKKVESQNRVKSITFHQSYSYEEFIEGIRPILGDDDTDKIGYKLENGIFKELCINAEKELIKRQDNNSYIDMIDSGSSIWKVSLGKRNDVQTYKECIVTSDIAVNYDIDEDISGYTQEEILELLEEDKTFYKKPVLHASTLYALANEMLIGDIVMVYDSPKTIRMIGIVSDDYRYDGTRQNYKHRRKVRWLDDLKYPIDIFKYNGGVNLTLKTIYPLNNMEITDVIKILSENTTKEQTIDDKRQIKPYYLIIDEINRGNISKIFGELITLIEQDKRGVYKTVLPYSKKEFTVPSNLYIIGTMNTADRSIATMDTALRRRFTFVEINPDSSVIAEVDNPIVNDNIDLVKLMDTLNSRILERYDRDHRIGHSYFMGIDSLSNLYQTWYFKIIPLLSEYFYNDIDSLREVVGPRFFDESGNVNYFSIKQEENGLSEFENALLDIYR